MDPVLKNKWIEALRSGKYKQGRGMLRDSEDNFCCLGVLCDITKDIWWKEDPGGKYYRACYGESQSWCYLPQSYRGFNNIDGGRLSNINDKGKTFAEIADYIEENSQLHF